MLVIADTTPLNYLILIEAIDLLPGLYPKVILPRAVWLELQQRGAPAAVALWAQKLPGWIEVRPAPLSNDPSLTTLGAGEREAITLAELYRHETLVLLLLDEEAARQLARERHIPATGTLGILTAASGRRLDRLGRCLSTAAPNQFSCLDVSSRRITAEGCGAEKQPK